MEISCRSCALCAAVVCILGRQMGGAALTAKAPATMQQLWGNLVGTMGQQLTSSSSTPPYASQSPCPCISSFICTPMAAAIRVERGEWQGCNNYGKFSWHDVNSHHQPFYKAKSYPSSSSAFTLHIAASLGYEAKRGKNNNETIYLTEDFTRLHLAFPCPPSSTCTLRKGEVKKRVYGNYEEELWENLVGTLLRGPPLPSPPLRDQVHVHFQNPIHFLPVGTIGGEAKNYGKLIVFALSENQNHLQILESKESRFLDVWFTFLNLRNHTVV